MSLDLTKDLNLFDVKQLRISEEKQRIYYKLHKGKYSAIFYLGGENMYLIVLDKREEGYKQWR